MMAWEGWAHTSKTEFDFDKMLREIKAIGYDGVEIGGGETTLGKPRDLLQKFADNGLEIATFGAGVTANPYSPNTAEYRRSMDYAAELGVKVIAVFCRSSAAILLKTNTNCSRKTCTTRAITPRNISRFWRFI